MAKQFLFIVFVLSLSTVKGQKQNYRYIDDYVQLFTTECKTPEDLIKSLIKKNWSENEKVRAIYGWIAKNITYNINFDNTLHVGEYEIWEKVIALRTFEKKEGICGNYAALFKLLCGYAGIEARIVNGYMREHGSIQAGIPVKEINHAWNIVKTNDKEHLIDITWGSLGGYEYDSLQYNYFFYTAPERFIATRFSNDQLLSDPVKKCEFDQYPYVSDCFFYKKEDSIFPKQGIIKTNNGLVEIKISHPDTLYLLPHILTNSQWINLPYRFKQQGKMYILSVNIKDLPEDEYIVTLGTLCNGYLAFRVIYKKEE